MVVDFSELRNRILAGEEDAREEALPTPLRTELREDNSTLFSILFGGSLLGVSMLDRAKHDGAIFTTQNGNSYGPLADALGFGSLMFGLGRLSRGLSAQDEINNYDEAFLTGTAAEITPVRSIDSVNFQTGENTKTFKFMSDFSDLVNNTN